VNGEELLLAEKWTVRYVATLPREHPELYDQARPELALPHTTDVAWNPLENALQWMMPPGVDRVHLPLAAGDLVGTKLTTGAKGYPVGPDRVVELDALPSPARQARLFVPGTEMNRPLLTGPVTYRFQEGVLANGSWFAQGLRSYVGAIRMRQTFRLDDESARDVILDLGRVEGAASVEARLNGKPLGRRVDAPFHFDLAGHLRRGDNELELLVRNTPGRDCGVFGPVMIRRSPDSSSKT
jgi:hypothetical protein